MMALDLFSGAGLVHDGLVAAGFTVVVGVDLLPQPRYPGPFLQHDALTLDPRFLAMFDFIWASPPCQKHTALRHAKNAKEHVDLIPPTREMLIRSGKPYCIENVVGAPLINPVTLTGYMFDLGVTLADGRRFHLERSRIFETNFHLPAPAFTRRSPVIGIYGAHVRCRAKAAGGRGTRDFIGEDKPALAHGAMGLRRKVTMEEISQGVPPRYAQHVASHVPRP